MKLEDYCYAHDIDLQGKVNLKPHLRKIFLLEGMYQTFEHYLSNLQSTSLYTSKIKRVQFQDINSATPKKEMESYSHVAGVQDKLIFHEGLITNPFGPQISSQRMLRRALHGDTFSPYEIPKKYYQAPGEVYHEVLEAYIDKQHFNELLLSERTPQELIEKQVAKTVDGKLQLREWVTPHHPAWTKYEQFFRKYLYESNNRLIKNITFTHPSLPGPIEAFTTQVACKTNDKDYLILGRVISNPVMDYLDTENLVVQPGLEIYKLEPFYQDKKTISLQSSYEVQRVVRSIAIFNNHK